MLNPSAASRLARSPPLLCCNTICPHSAIISLALHGHAAATPIVYQYESCNILFNLNAHHLATKVWRNEYHGDAGLYDGD